MRLNFHENKIKTYFSLFAFAFVVSFIVLFGLRLDVHAESLSSFPLPFGPCSNWGFSNPNDVHIPNDSDLSAFVSGIETSTGNTVYGLFIYEIASDYSYVDFAVAFNDFWYLMPNNTYPSMPYNDSLNLCSLGTVNIFSTQIWRFDSSGSFSYTNRNLNVPSQVYYFSGGVSSSDTFYSWYPYWHIDNEPILVSPDWSGSNVGFVYSGSGGSPDFSGHSIGGSGSGSFIPSPDNPSTVTGFDFDINLNYDDSGITSRLDTLNDNVSGLGDKIDVSNNWLGRIWSAISDYFSAPDPNEITDTLDDYPLIIDLTSTVNDTKSTVNNIFDFQSIQPKTADNVDFDYDFQWKVYVPQLHAFQTRTTRIHIVFSWFESIRTPVTLVLTVFLVLGFLVYVFRQIPNLINGVGAGASAGQSIADMNNNSSGKGNGKK